MPTPGDLNAFAVSRITQGIGGLFLVLVCCALYFHRRRRYFLFWTLSCFSFNASLLLRAPLFMGGSLPGVFERAPVWLWLANLGGWEHGALLLLGMWFLFREARPPLPVLPPRVGEGWGGRRPRPGPRCRFSPSSWRLRSPPLGRPASLFCLGPGNARC